MEGRKRPPKASYFFPNNPDMTKFWSNPQTVKGYFKFASVGVVGYFSIMGLYYYFTKDDLRICNMKVPTMEQQKARFDALQAASKLRRKVPSALNFNVDKLVPIKLNAGIYPDHGNMQFDDGFDFRPGDPTVFIDDPERN